MTVNNAITHRVNKHINEHGIKKMKLQELLHLSKKTLWERLNNKSNWQFNEVEILRENKIVRIIVK